MYLTTAIEAAKSAGAILMAGLNKLTQDQIVQKQECDFVTEIDTRSEKAIIQHITSRYPDHHIHAEESGHSESNNPFQWIIDPLDGTKNYIHGFPMFAVSIALMVEKELKLGVILDPVHDELFYAEINKGAYLNDKPIHVSQTDNFSQSLLGTGFPFRAKHLTEKYFTTMAELFGHISDFRRPGAAALDLAYVACGRLDGFWEILLNPWDIAAGTIMIEEAGGTVTDLFGADSHLTTGNIVASNSLIHQNIVTRLTPAFEDVF